MEEKVFWISDNGHIISFSKNPPFFLAQFVPNSLGATSESYSAPQQDGATTYATVYNPRTLTLRGYLSARGATREDRRKGLHELQQQLCSALDPKCGGKLVYQNAAGTYEIFARPKELPAFGNRYSFSNSFTIDWIADNPLWREATENIKQAGQVVGGMHFPWIVPTRFGEIINVTTLINDDHMEIPLIIEIMSTMTNVRITNNSTGQHIEINREIEENHKMIIDTGRKTVTLKNLMTSEEEDASHYITVLSDYFNLAPGINEIIVDNSTSEDDIPLVYFRWHRHLLGV